MAVFDDMKGITVASGFKLQAERPLDARQQVDTYDQLAELVSSNGAWEGMMVYVVADKKTYRYDGTDWAEVATGGDTDGRLNYYGVCDTATTVAAKTVTIDDFPSEYKNGMRVTIRFEEGLESGVLATLNINNLGAIQIVYTDSGTDLKSIASNTVFCDSGGIVSFVYFTSGTTVGHFAIDAPETVWFSIRADKATSVADKGVTTSALVDGSVTRDKIDTDAVGTDQIEDGTVTAAKLAKDVKSSLVTVDEKLSYISTNPVQNKVIADKFDAIQEKVDENKSIMLDNQDILLYAFGSYNPLYLSCIYGICGQALLDDLETYPAILYYSDIMGEIEPMITYGYLDRMQDVYTVASPFKSEVAFCSFGVTSTKNIVYNVQGILFSDGSMYARHRQVGTAADETLPYGSWTDWNKKDDYVNDFRNKLVDFVATRPFIEPNSVTETMLANKAVTSDKLKDQSVTKAKLSDLSVTVDKLAANSVTTDKINDLAVTTAKLSTRLQTKFASKLESRVVSALLSNSASYDFEDEVSVFTVPVIGTAVKGVSSVATDDENGNRYQSVGTGTGTIGGDASVYSEFAFPDNLTSGATDITIELDFMYSKNGRMRIAFADLGVLGKLSNSAIRWNTDGIAFDFFSNQSNVFQINGKGSAHASFFGAWLHAKLVFDFSTNKVTYEVYLKSDETDKLSGTVEFHGDCSEVNGIAMYTWQTSDYVYYDNISITARIGAEENTRYLIPNGNSGYDEYQYIDGQPICVSGGRTATDGGFEGGTSAKATSGGAVGLNASSTKGGAVGWLASSGDGGGAVGAASYANRGGAIGDGAKAYNGFAGGQGAVCGDTDNHLVDNIQLGKGNNTTAGTLQVYDKQLMDADGYIPPARMVAVYTSDTLPTASESLRGKTCIVESDTGDLVYICRKNSSGGYEWKDITGA